ncbi:hypothetical protein BGZ76_002199, partial [Entomortierella beljakovae]
MDRSTPLFPSSAFDLLDDFGSNPFITNDDSLNTTSLSSSDCLDSSKIDMATASTAHIDLLDINNINNNNSNNNSLWDFIPADDHDPTSVINNGLDLTPELSPSMSLYSPAVNSVNSPFGFDGLGLDDYIPSPSVAYRSPFEESFGTDQISETFGFDFDCGINIPNMADFQLFPDMPKEPTSSKKLQTSTSVDPFTLDEFHSEPTPTCDSISPSVLEFSFSTAKTLGQDVQVPIPGVAPRKLEQSPTKPGFKPTIRRRRRRITSEEASRVVPEESLNDPNAKARFKCSQCNKTFSRPFNLRSHRATHLGVKPYACTQETDNGAPCHWTFARRHDLERHIRSRHDKSNLYTCKTCGVQVTRTDAFKRHLSRNAACGGAASEDQDMDQ